MYPNGATVALVQPTTAYGLIECDAPALLAYDISAADYIIPDTVTYDMPPGLIAELITDGHTNTNTDFVFTIFPDHRTVPDISTLTFDSDIFEISGIPLWNAGTGEWIVALKLKTDWDNPANSLKSVFEFESDMDAANFKDGEFLHLTGMLKITAVGKNYVVPSNDAPTEMRTQKYAVTYDVNGGFGAAPTETDKIAGETFTIASDAGLTAPIAAQQFKEWNTANDGTGASYASGDTITMPANALIFFAIWENVYTIDYDANGGNGAIPSGTAVHGSNYNIAANTFTRTGYTFTGWNTAADGSGTAYAAGAAIVNVQADTTLYAQWKSGGGGGGSGGGTIIPPPSVPEDEGGIPDQVPENNTSVDPKNESSPPNPTTPVKQKHWMLPLLII
jgi:uncharacterized repeat protein (TIGR02543 family)